MRLSVCNSSGIRRAVRRHSRDSLVARRTCALTMSGCGAGSDRGHPDGRASRDHRQWRRCRRAGANSGGAGPAMIPMPGNVRVWLATGHTDMRKGFASLSLCRRCRGTNRTQTAKLFERKPPARKPFPDHLQRERIVIAAPESCPCSGPREPKSLAPFRLCSPINEIGKNLPYGTAGPGECADAYKVQTVPKTPASSPAARSRACSPRSRPCE